MQPKDTGVMEGSRDTEGTTLADLRHRLGTLDRVKLDASIERMVEALIESARSTFDTRRSLNFAGNIRVSGKAYLGETGIRVSMESEGEIFCKSVEKIAYLGFRPKTPDRLGGNYIVGEKPK